MADSRKRKGRAGGDNADRGVKRSKGGSGGKWQTPHQQAKAAALQRGKIEPGDVGIWATCAQNQERRAAVELKAMLEECAERFYGIKSGSSEQENDDASDDIEAAIQKEVASMDRKEENITLFTSIRVDLPCVLFFKTLPTIDPVDLVHRICEEITANQKIRRMRYINRLTPMTLIGKATEKGLDEVLRSVVEKHFNLIARKDEAEDGDAPDQKAIGAPQDHGNCSYAIRPTFRNHNTLKRDAVIKQIASSIADTHKVDLTNPEKVIIVEIYQTVCGMSVVGSDWEALKRFNLAELYSHNKPPSQAKAASDAEAKPQSATTDENGMAPARTDSAGP